MFQDIANIHSRKGADSPTDTVTIIEHKDNNHVVEEVENARLCRNVSDAVPVANTNNPLHYSTTKVLIY